MMKTVVKPLYPFMIHTLERLVNINSGSYNHKGINLLASSIQELMSPFVDQIILHQNEENGHLIALEAIRHAKLKQVKKRVLFNIHMDTVFPSESSFQVFERIDEHYAKGPGVIDAKGGLVVLMTALKLMQDLSECDGLEICVLMNTDEELGSPHSSDLIKACARQKDIALVFEPVLENGHMILERPATAFIEVIATGVSAHAGRHFEKGINAIDVLLEAIQKLDIQAYQGPKTRINLGVISGGTKANVVPKEASCQVNVRALDEKTLGHILTSFQQSIKTIKGVRLDVKTKRPARKSLKRHPLVFQALKQSLNDLGMNLDFESSFGVCDANSIDSIGVPVIDTLGPLGTGMHTESETIFLPSLVDKVALSLQFLKTLS